MKILPIDKSNYTLYPLPANNIGVIEITEEQYGGLQNGTHCFNEELTELVLWVKTETEVNQENLLIQEMAITKLRAERISECFNIVNRGQVWYDTLTETQKSELTEWYQNWLDVTQTGVTPQKPEWLLK